MHLFCVLISLMIVILIIYPIKAVKIMVYDE